VPLLLELVLIEKLQVNEFARESPAVLFTPRSNSVVTTSPHLNAEVGVIVAVLVELL
jgi:hypothetical protein